MFNKNRLIIENHRLLDEIQTNTATFASMLDTMAKFHKYNIWQQMNFHFHAPTAAKALASEEVWTRAMGTALVHGATPIPILQQDPEHPQNYLLGYVYDVKDTVAYATGDQTFQELPWQYREETDLELVKETLGEPDAATLDEAIHTAVQKYVAKRDTDYPSLLSASVEYIIRTRLGLSHSQDDLSYVNREGIRMEMFLEEVNHISKDLLNPLGASIRKLHTEIRDQEAREELDDAELRDLGRDAQDVHEGEPAREMDAAPADGQDGDVPRDIQRNDGEESQQTADGAVRTRGIDRGTENGESVSVDEEVSSRETASVSDNHGRSAFLTSFSISADMLIDDAIQAVSNRLNEISAIADEHPEDARTATYSLIDVLSEHQGTMFPPKTYDDFTSAAYKMLADITPAVTSAEEPIIPVVLEATAENTSESDAEVEDTMELSIRTWYQREYPDDAEGRNLADVTFTEFLGALDAGEDIYETLHIGASDIRERLFLKATELSGLEYEEIYAQFLNSSSFSQTMGEVVEDLAADVATPEEIETLDAPHKEWLVRLTREVSIEDIAASISYGFSREDLAVLADLHENRADLKATIEDLMKTCNFHQERAFLVEGDYTGFRAHLQEESEMQAEASVVSQEEQSTYRYFMIHRPAGPGAVPEGFTHIDNETRQGYGFGAIMYPRPLTKEELSSYEIAPANMEAAVIVSEEHPDTHNIREWYLRRTGDYDGHLLISTIDTWETFSVNQTLNLYDNQTYYTEYAANHGGKIPSKEFVAKELETLRENLTDLLREEFAYRGLPIKEDSVSAEPVQEEQPAEDTEETTGIATEGPAKDGSVSEPLTLENHVVSADGPIDDTFEGIDLSTLDFDATMENAAGKRAVFLRNLAAIQIINHLENTGHRPTEEQVRVLRAYSGFGGIPEAFDSRNRAWANEYKLAKETLTDAQYRAARSSTLTAFYTPHDVIHAIYSGLESYGFKGGNILDPSTGTGRFLEDMPESMKEESRLYGIELDLLTAQVAKYTNSDATIFNDGFEHINHKNDSFDMAITNVPFMNLPINDPEYPDHNYLIHDYFVIKMLDKVRANGLSVVITSRGTMDKKDSTIRQELAKKGELVAAFRFPNTVFAGAGTEAVSDLLIFRKRERELANEDPMPDWVNSVEQEKNIYGARGGVTKATYNINQYFIDNPENILGVDTVKSTAYGYDLDVKEDRPMKLVREKDGHEAMTRMSFAEQLEKRIKEVLPEGGYTVPDEKLPAPEFVTTIERNTPYGYYYENNELTFLAPDGTRTTPSVSTQEEARIRSAIHIRDAIRDMFDAETHRCDDETLAKHQAKLDALYESHVKNFGRINEDRSLKRLFGQDSASTLLMSLEIYDDGNYKGKSKLFAERTILAYEPPTHADTAEEALAISLQEKGRVDIRYMSELSEKSPEEIVTALEFTSIFEDLQTDSFMPADEYLSGNIRARIAYLEDLMEQWNEDIHLLAEDSLYPQKRVETFNFKQYEPPFNDEDFYQFDWRSMIEKMDEKTAGLLMSAEYRPVLAVCLKHVHHWQTKRFFDTLVSKFPNTADTIQDVDLSLQLLPYAETYQDVINYHLPGSEVMKSILERSGIAPYMDKERDVMEYLAKKYREYAHGEHPEALEGDLRSEYDAFTKEYKENIERYIQEGGNRDILDIQSDIERFQKNLSALEKVKPRDLSADEITINLGASWIPPKYINKFIRDTFRVIDNPYVEYSKITGAWKVGLTKYDNSKVNDEYGVEGKNALELTQYALNHGAPVIYKTKVIDGEEKRVTDHKATLLATQKIQRIRDEFSKWIFQDENRKNYLVDYYNEKFNCLVPRKFNGDNLSFPGMSPEIKLRKHQKDAVARTLYGGNTLFAHTVGAGKTFEMQASAMESKRIGLCKKPVFIMPKHLTQQFGSEFNRLYPNAKILVATEKDSKKENRRLFASKIASQDWDAIVMSYEQFQKIPLSYERRQAFIQKEIDKAMEGYNELKRMVNGNGFTVKQAEAKIKELRAKLDKMTEDYKKHQDATVTFEQLGIDRLYVDESHNYKNLSFFTRMRGVQSNGAQKTDDLIAKIDYLNEITNERGVVFASGTPVSNSLSELYTLQRYLRPSRLKEADIEFFDSWAMTFGREVTHMELSPDGKSYSNKTRFARFENVPELISMYHEFADVKTAAMLDLDVPECEIVVDKSPASDIQKEMIMDLVDRAALVKAGTPIVVNEAAAVVEGKGLDNMLVITKDGMDVALDPRILDKTLPDNPESKVNHCIKNVMDIYEHPSIPKSTQIIFCDRSTPKPADSKKHEEAPFTVYEDIKQKLIEKGVPEKEIAIIHDYDKATQKEALFQRMRKGEVRILLGSSEKLGVGTNVQDLLEATHDLDCPWKPSQIEQRRGRIVRKGNKNKKVKIFRYITEGSFDAYMWQTNERKQRFISQIMSDKCQGRSMEDIDETALEFSGMKAACMDNPVYKELAELQQEVEVLSFERASHLEIQSKYQKELVAELPEAIKNAEGKIAGYQKDLSVLAEHASEEEKNTLLVNGKAFAGAEIGKAMASYARAFAEGKIEKTPTGTYRGMKVSMIYSQDSHRVEFCLMGQNTIHFPIGSTTPIENQNRLQFVEENMKGQCSYYENERETLTEREAEAKEMVEKPFEKEDLYQAKKIRMEELQAIVTTLDEKEELNREIRVRTSVIKDPTKYDGDDLLVKAYLEQANLRFMGNDMKWEDRFDREILREMTIKGYDKEKVKEAIFKKSPVVPDKEKLSEYLCDNANCR